MPSSFNSIPDDLPSPSQLDAAYGRTPGEASQESANYAASKSAMSYVETAAREGVTALKNLPGDIIKSSPIGAGVYAAQGDTADIPGFTGALVRVAGLDPSKYGTAGKAAFTLGVTAASTAEWIGINEAAGALEFLAEPAVAGALSPMFSETLKQAAESGGKQIVENAAVGRMTHILSQSLVAGSLGAALPIVGAAIEGKSVPRLRGNVAGNMLLGALGGAFDAPTRKAITENLDTVLGARGEIEKSGEIAFDNLANKLSAEGGYTKKAAIAKLAEVYNGKHPAGAVVPQWILAAADTNPELFRHNLMKDLLETAKNPSHSPQELTADDVMAKLKSLKNPAPSPVDAAFNGQHNLLTNPNEQRTQLPTRRDIAKTDLQLIARGQPSGPTIHLPDNFTPPAPAPVSGMPDESAVFSFSAATDLGIPVAAPGLEFMLPPGKQGAIAVPDAPQLQQPLKLTPFQRAAFDLAKGSDYEALEGHITKNGAAKVSFGNMLARGLLKPEHVTTSDMANTVQGFLEDTADTLQDSGKATPAKLSQLEELANAFAERSARLRGESQVFTRNRYLREPASGEIVRTISDTPDTKTVIDRKGKTAIVRAADFPAPTVAHLPPQIDITSADHLKQVEAALYGERVPIVEPAATPGIMPIPRAVEEARADASSTTPKVGAPEKPTVVKGKVRSTAARLAARMKSEKGAVTVPTSTRVTGTATSALLSRMGHDLYRTPKGTFIVKLANGDEYVVPHDEPILEAIGRITSMTRASKEFEDSVTESTAHLDDTSTTLKHKAGAPAAVPFPKTDISYQLEFNALSRDTMLREGMPGGTSRPFSVRSGWLNPTSYFANQLVTQKVKLTEYGEGGVLLANMLNAVARGVEIQDALKESHHGGAIDYLKRVTTNRAIENGTAAPHDLDLWKRVVSRDNDEVYGNSIALGIPVEDRIANKNYVHHFYNFTEKDIPESILPLAHALGVASSKEELAHVLNDPESAIPEPPPQVAGAPQQEATMGNRQPLDVADRMRRVQWAREQAASMSGALERQRRGNAGYSDDVAIAQRHYDHSTSVRTVEAAILGANNENLTRAYQMIAKNSAQPWEAVQSVGRIVADARHRLHLPLESKGGEVYGNFLRFWTITAPTRHIFQTAFMWMKFGPVRSTLNSMRAIANVWSEDRKLAGAFGALMRHGARELEDDPHQFLGTANASDLSHYDRIRESLRLPAIAKTVGDAGSLPIHGTLNLLRWVSFENGRYAFDNFFTRAAAGNTDALADLNNALKTRFGTADLANLKARPEMYNAMKMQFAKATADFVGTTYRPEDFPQFMRNPFGRQLGRFRTFQWNLVHNVLDETFNEHYSYKRRATAALRLLAAIPVLGAIDPILRHHASLGTINSEVAYDAIQRFKKDPKLNTFFYSMVTSTLNAGVLGLATDAIQGFNLLNPALTARATAFDAVGAAPLADFTLAAARAMRGIATDDPRQFRAAQQNLLAILGPASTPFERVSGKRAVRLPKKMVIREMFGVGR